MRARIRLDTLGDIKAFISTVAPVTENITLEDNDGHCVSAKSLMGAIYSMEWDAIYCNCDKDITTLIMNWVI
jgi:hypothetical protein